MDPQRREMMARALLGNGMAGQAADSMQTDPQYQQYAMMAQMAGQQPLPRTDPSWMQQFQQMQAGQ